MSLCLAVMVVFGFLGIFSARYRKWAKESFGCVGRMITFRPCTATFKQKARAKVTSVIMKRHMGLARFTHRHFEAISWVFTIMFFLSLGYTGYSLYNLAVYGTCDPVTGNCVFAPGGNPNRVVCPFESLNLSDAVPTIGGFSKVPNAVPENKMYFFGTTWCPHCGWERPIYQKVAAKFSGSIVSHKIEIDVDNNSPHLPVFSHYSPDGYIPLLVIGGKYFRVGSGERLGNETEENILTALMCDVSGSQIPECSEQDIAEIIKNL